MSSNAKPRLLTGDTPTGKLHLGHYVGSLENRIALQDEYECYFILANIHAYTTRFDRPKEIHDSVIDIAIDYLGAGIDPDKSTIFIQSEIPAISELTFLFSMLLPYPRVMRNPTIKDEIRDKDLGDNYPFGFLLYSVGQVADILAFRPEIVPVGEDQLPHIEMTREVARRFNQFYCGVNSHAPDAEQLDLGGILPIVKAKLGRTKRLIGTGAPSEEGQLLKMSKSLNNAILLSDDNDVIKKKVMGMYTDPNRLKATDPGCVENNPLWIFHETFNHDKAWLDETQERYRQGTVGDVECKRALIDVLVSLIEPIRERRQLYENDKAQVLSILKEGSQRANAEAQKTLALVKDAMKLSFF